ncbi:MAG: hypothetical protein EXS49_00270, partial [Candidatus Pacebacteria bacterium]|nr:hypothetical protein [Candidatus Paceibacterota bacterium]
ASSVNVPATITDDAVVESSETIILTLTSSASYIIGSPNTGTVTITDNDGAGLPTVTISTTDANASESGDPGTFVFTRTGSITSGLLIYISVSGTATNGIDYPDLPSSILIPAGSSSLTINGFPIDDTLVEPSETVTLTFISHSSYTIGSPNSATINIADNDSTGTPTITINADDPTASELGSDTGVFTISRTGSTASALTALFTISGSAINGSDYQQTASSITIPSGSSYTSLTLTPINDSTVESTETATLTLSSDSSYIIDTQNTATANILDNDGSSGQTTPPPTNNSNNTALSPAPSNFSGLALTPDKAYLSWNLISGASGIELSEGLDSATFNKTYNLPGNYYYYKPSVTPGSTHSYRIRSYDGSGNFSEFSNIVQISTTNSVAQFTKSLYYGIDDVQVSLLQQCLKNDSNIYPSGKITSHFGPLTETGVRKFQSKYGINPIGIVGPLTRAKLNASCGSVSATSSSTPSPTSTVKPVSVNYNLNFDLILGIGSSNDQVSLLQAILAKNPSLYPSGLVSGYYGPLTEAAVKNFQLKYGIDPSGSVGTKTITKLNEFRLSGLNP